MPTLTFYICDICGGEIREGEKCHKAIKSYGGKYHGTMRDYDLTKYICQTCLPFPAPKIEVPKVKFRWTELIAEVFHANVG